MSLNPYKLSVRFVGHRQTVQNQIRRRKKRRLTGSPLFANRIFYQNLNKNEKHHPTTLKQKWTGPIVGKFIRLEWDNTVASFSVALVVCSDVSRLAPFCLLVCFVALRPMQQIWSWRDGQSLNHTFSCASLDKLLTSTSCRYFSL